MNSLVSSFIGWIDRFTEVESVVEKSLPIFKKLIHPDLIEKGYKKHEEQTGEKIQRRSGGKLEPIRVICIELSKALKGNISYNQALQECWTNWKKEGIVTRKQPQKSSLSEARERIPENVYLEILKAVKAKADRILEHDRMSWRGHTIKTIDGTPLSLPNRPEIREQFKIHSNKDNTAYWPKAEMIWVASVGTGIIEQEQMLSPQEGEESVVPYILGENAEEEDLILGDAKNGTTVIMDQIQQAGSCFLVRAHTSIQIQKNVIKKYSEDDLLIELEITDYMKKKYSDLDSSDSIRVRAIRRRTEDRKEEWFLTNLAGEQYPAEELREVFLVRWSHETLNREIKTDQGLGQIRSEEKERIRKEILSNLIVYNLLRLAIASSVEDRKEELLQQKKQENLKKEILPKQDQQQQKRQKKERKGTERKRNKDKVRQELSIPLLARRYSFTRTRQAVQQANQQLIHDPESKQTILECLIDNIREAKIKRRKKRKEPRMVRPRKSNYSEFLGTRQQWREKNGYG